jgi:hypothetical protein
VLAIACVTALLLLPLTGAAQSLAHGADAATATIIDGPPPPVAPEVVSRDASGRVTLRATRLTTPLVLDGRLDEQIYETVPPIGDFVQQEPHEGEPATDKTDAWIFFDDKNVFVSLRCWSTDPDGIVADAMARDSQNIFQNENIGVAFDTFYDRRNGVFFQTNALGGLRDGSINDETNVNYDWNTEWDVKSRRFEHGWTTERAIPSSPCDIDKGANRSGGSRFSASSEARTRCRTSSGCRPRTVCRRCSCSPPRRPWSASRRHRAR